jgi:type I restriction enzyme S subunit
LSEINVVVSTGYIVLQSNDRLIKKYTRWLLQQFDVAHMKTLGSGVRQTINYSDIGNSFFFEPSQDEQEQIANFLDHETSKIDTLIDKQQQLIKLLKEKRQAVISHAVTKGLNPAAPMKDSGVEWLGEVPEHWVVTKSSYVFASSPRNGISPAMSDSNNAIPTFSISAVRNGEVDIENNLKWTSLSTDEAEKFRVNSNDILLVRGNGNLSMVGQAGSVNGIIPSKCIYPDILIKVEISKSKMTNEFFVNSWNEVSTVFRTQD